MRVQQLQRSSPVVADHAGNPRQCEFQLFRFRRWRKKQASLRRTRPGRHRSQMELHDGRAGRMRIQIQLQQFEEKFGVEHGQGQTQSPTESALPAGNKILRRRVRLTFTMRRVALAGDAEILKFLINPGPVLEIQSEP